MIRSFFYCMWAYTYALTNKFSKQSTLKCNWYRLYCHVCGFTCNLFRNALYTEGDTTATLSATITAIYSLSDTQGVGITLTQDVGAPISANDTHTEGVTTTIDLGTIVTAFSGGSDIHRVNVTQDITSGSDLTFPGQKPASPISFHVHHGSSITLSADYGTATRYKNRWDNSICFSNRSLHVNERVALRILNITKMPYFPYNGKFGFISVDPATLDPAALPKYANRLADLANEFWLDDPLDRALSNTLAVGDILHYYLMTNGSVCYGINDGVRVVSSSSLPTNRLLWAVIDMYGEPIALQFVNFSPQIIDLLKSCH